MMKKREGFTLIELLIVIVIIGILAAIAIPKFGATREKAYFKAMMSDLRNLQAQEELYYSNNPAYAYFAGSTSAPGGTITELDFTASAGVSVTTVLDAGTNGWYATATHEALPDTEKCAIWVGTGETAPAAAAPATASGVIACTDAMAPAAP